MFPTFISILDVQSWWEVPSIAHFCSLFRSAFNLLDFDIEDLEEALLTDGTEDPSWLQELIVRLLSGCLPNNEISTFNYQMFLRRLFRQKCQEYGQYNPFNTDIDFQLLPLRTKVEILYSLCDYRLDAEDVTENLKNLEADSLRVEPLGYDNNKSAYWYFYGTRLYREDFYQKGKKTNKSVWQVICFTEEDWIQVTKKFKLSSFKVEKRLYNTLSKNFLPELPRLFKEKERLARKRILERQLRRAKDKEIHLNISNKEIEEKANEFCKENVTEVQQQQNNSASYVDCDSTSETYKNRIHPLEISSDNSGSLYNTSDIIKSDEMSSKVEVSSIRRQTNNSLACATGNIIIQPAIESNKKKLKSSQIFHQTQEDLQTGMHKILNHLKNHEDAWPFIDPVEEEFAPNYYSIIRKPMDLQKMEDRLDSGYYKNFSRFRADFLLIVENCRLYNGAKNEYTEMVDNLLSVFKTITKKYLDQNNSSDDEISVEFPNKTSGLKGTKKKDTTEIQSSKRKSNLKRKAKESNLNIKSKTRDREIIDVAPKKLKSKKKGYKQSVKSKSKIYKEENKEINNKSAKSKHKLLKESDKSNTKVKEHKSSLKSSTNRKEIIDNTEVSSASDTTKEKLTKSTIKSAAKLPKLQESNKLSYENIPDETSVQHKDKHNKLRETIEKLKAKSEITSKFKEKEPANLILDSKNEKDYIEKDIISSNKANSLKSKAKVNDKIKIEKQASASDINKFDQLSLVSEETLKDISMWLDSPPKFSDSSDPNDILPSNKIEELDNKSNQELKLRKQDNVSCKKEVTGKDKKKNMPKENSKIYRKKDVQRTIDRLQPGKSKGNLLSNSASAAKVEETNITSVVSKIKDSKNALIVKTDNSTPKLNLGSVLDNFDKHTFIDDLPKKCESNDHESKPKESAQVKSDADTKVSCLSEQTEVTDENIDTSEPNSSKEATPNLSAWFKAFGAPKVQPTNKKSDSKDENKDAEKDDSDSKTCEQKKDEARRVVPPEKSPSLESPLMAHGLPVGRQRKISTGSSVSERSSFSQDLDSPRVGYDDQLGAYPAPYPSPLHKSPSGVSPVMISPGLDASPKAAYSAFNGQIRVGFYQDTVSSRSSPDKSSSPRDPPLSPYPQQSEHVYVPPTSQPYNYSCSSSSLNPQSSLSLYSNPTITTYNTEERDPSMFESNKINTNQILLNKKPTNSSNILSESTNLDSFQDNFQTEEKQSTSFPVKKRAYSDIETTDVINNLVEHKSFGLQDPFEKKSSTHHILNENESHSARLHQMQKNQVANFHQATKYMHDKMPPAHEQQFNQHVTNLEQKNLDYFQDREQNSARPSSNQSLIYGYNAPATYPINVPSTKLLDDEKKSNITKFMNTADTMTQYDKSVSSHLDNNYHRTISTIASQSQISYDQGQTFSNNNLRYADAISNANYKPGKLSNQDMNNINYQHSRTNVNIPSNIAQQSSFNTAVSEQNQTLGLPGSMVNLPQMPERYQPEEHLMQNSSMLYPDKNSTSNMFPKHMTNPSALSILSQPNIAMNHSHNISTSTASIFNKQFNNISNASLLSDNSIITSSHAMPEKKNKRRKLNKSVALPVASNSNQGFQSYAELKTCPSALESNPIKATTIVPGSAFNFGSSAPGLGLGSGIYGEKDGFNILEDFRPPGSSYYMTPPTSHHRSTDPSDKPAGATTNYPFIGSAPPRPPAYTIGGPLMPPHQTPFMDASTPIYQQYFQAGVMHQGLLGSTTSYPPGYHTALSMRQTYDSMTRPHWL